MKYEFGITSCFHEKLPLILTRVFLGVALQILCSYITFPLYALVTQVRDYFLYAAASCLELDLKNRYDDVFFSFYSDGFAYEVINIQRADSESN